MPHLSPMNWISMLISLTLLIMFLNSNMWWKPQPKFFTSIKSSHSLYNSWNWL